MFSKLGFWHYLLIIIPAPIVASYSHLPAYVTFVFAAVVLVPLAYFLSEATEVIVENTGEHFSGIINVTFGNTAELVIAILAISRQCGRTVCSYKQRH